MSISINGANGLTFPDTTTQNTGGYTGFRNRIINGDMRIDQRNEGSAVTVNTSGQVFPVDRFACAANGGGAFTAQKSTNVPSGQGFTNSLVLTVTTQDASLAGGDYYWLRQNIEGYNVADLCWGQAGAKSAVLSFFVRSSVTGVFGGALKNEAADRSYPFTFTVIAANTWEYKTVVIPGDVTGTWEVSSARGVTISWSVGGGTDVLGTPNVWAAANRTGATGQTNLIATSGATFYITGVQFEKGPVATPFEFRPYGLEFDLCRRYCEVFVDGPEGSIPQSMVQVDVDNRVETNLCYYPKRVAPTITVSDATVLVWLSMANTLVPCTDYLGTLVGTTPIGGVMYFNVASGVTQSTLSAMGTLAFSDAGSITVSAEF